MVDVHICETCHKSVGELKAYYVYDIPCECCQEGKHITIVHYCEECKPKEPKTLLMRIKTETLKELLKHRG